MGRRPPRATAARTLIRANVPERVAMLLTGHKTRAIVDRDHSIHEQERLDAGDQLVASLARQAQAPRGHARRDSTTSSGNDHHLRYARTPMCRGVSAAAGWRSVYERGRPIHRTVRDRIRGSYGAVGRRWPSRGAGRAPGDRRLITGSIGRSWPAHRPLSGPHPLAGATGSTASGAVRAKPPHPRRVFMPQRPCAPPIASRPHRGEPASDRGTRGDGASRRGQTRARAWPDRAAR